jgi:hypothetical protein
MPYFGGEVKPFADLRQEKEPCLIMWK